MKTVRHHLRTQLRWGLQGHFGRVWEGFGCRKPPRKKKLETLKLTNKSMFGTDSPFKLFGAPWLDAEKIIEIINSQHLNGVILDTVSFTPISIPGKSVYPKYRDTYSHALIHILFYIPIYLFQKLNWIWFGLHWFGELESIPLVFCHP